MAPVLGWSEQAAINASIEDEVVQAVLGMNQKHILPYSKFLVFSASSLPQSFSLLLPLSYLPPPSYLPRLILRSLH